MPAQQIAIPRGLLSCFLLIHAVFAFSINRMAAESPMPLPETTRTIDFLQGTKILDQTFDEVELHEICDYLESLTKHYDPDKKGIKFTIAPDLLKELQGSRKRSGFIAVSLMDIVDKACHNFEVRYSIEDDVVTFQKKSNSALSEG